MAADSDGVDKSQSDSDQFSFRETTKEYLKHLALARIPRRLFHFTSAQGLIGILASRKIWMSSVQFMNDSTEIEYARDLINSVVEEEASSNQNQLGAKLLRQLGPRIHEHPFGRSIDVYATSFCAVGDSLSLWRAYASQGGGYALGFDLRSHECPDAPNDVYLLKVEYNAKRQRALLRSGLRKFLAELQTLIAALPSKKDASEEERDKKGKELATAAVRGYLTTNCLPLVGFKHPSFADEKEWRLVTVGTSLDGPVMFRSARNFIAPYLEISLRGKKGVRKDELPLSKVIQGPTTAVHDDLKVLKALLKTSGVGHVEVAQSKVPLRY